LTLLATQTDFTEAGELTLFIDEDHVIYLEDLMGERSYVDGTQMAGRSRCCGRPTCSGRGWRGSTCWASGSP
jgi:hypothetical protein